GIGGGSTGGGASAGGGFGGGYFYSAGPGGPGALAGPGSGGGYSYSIQQPGSSYARSLVPRTTKKHKRAMEFERSPIHQGILYVFARLRCGAGGSVGVQGALDADVGQQGVAIALDDQKQRLDCRLPLGPIVRRLRKLLDVLAGIAQALVDGLSGE